MMISGSGFNSNIKSLVAMVNSRTQNSLSLEATQQSKQLRQMLHVLDKKNKQKTTDPEVNMASLEPPVMSEKQRHNAATNYMISDLREAYKSAQAMERYENLMQDDSYSDGMREIFQNSIDAYRKGAIAPAQFAVNFQLNRYTFGEPHYYMDLAAVEGKGVTQYMRDHASEFGFDGLEDLFQLSDQSSARDIMSAIENALSGLGDENILQLSEYELERFDAQNQFAINPQCYTTNYSELSNMIPEGGISIDLNRLENGLYSKEELGDMIRKMLEATRLMEAEREKIEKASDTYKHYKGIPGDQIHDYEPVRLEDSIFDLYV